MVNKLHTRRDTSQKFRPKSTNYLTVPEGRFSTTKYMEASLYLFWSRNSTVFAFVGAFACVCILSAVSISIVYISSSKLPGKKCRMTFNTNSAKLVAYNYGPRSVVLGDFNSDMWLDMVVANSIVGTIAVYFGHNDGTFSTPVEYSMGTGSIPNMVDVADFDNDRFLDIIVACYGVHTINIFLGFGDGNFKTQIIISTGRSRPISMSVGDFNSDKFVDIGVVNEGTYDISILYGHGNGNFSDSVSYSTGYDSLSSSLAFGDFDNDKHIDLVVANHGTNNIGIFFGNRDGSFNPQTMFSTGIGSRPNSIAVGDFNNDQLVDIAVANYGSKNIGIYLSCGNRTFKKHSNCHLDASLPVDIKAGDFNQDSYLDLVVANVANTNLAMLLGLGNGTFRDPTMYSTGASSAISLTIGDLNSDRRLDVVLLNNDTGALDILLGSFEGFNNVVTYEIGLQPLYIATGDFNNDDLMDFIVIDQFVNRICILFLLSNGSLVVHSEYATNSSSSTLAVADFNDDGRSDVVVCNQYTDDISIFIGDGNGYLEHLTEYSMGVYPYFVNVGDFDNDTRMDIVVTHVYDNDVSILFGYGNGSFTNRIRYPCGSGPMFISIKDINNDHILDMIVSNSGSNDISVFLGYGNGSFKAEMRYSAGTSPFSSVIGDFNQDDSLDLIVTNLGSNDVHVLLGYGNGSFAYKTRYSTGGYPTYVNIGDFNNDTLLDIVVVNIESEDITLLFSAGDGTFTDQIQIPMHDSLSNVIVGDFNNDARLDIIVSDWYASLYFFYQGNNGFLRSKTAIASGGHSDLRYIVSTDLDKDNQSDILVVNYGTNDISIFYGYGNDIFGHEMVLTTYSFTHPSCIAIGDFDNNNIFDIAVVNGASMTVGIFLGKGNRDFFRQADSEVLFTNAPVTAASGDFNKDRLSDIVIVTDQSDEIALLNTRNAIKFTQLDTYARDLYPTFMAAGDFNNDNLIDIAIVDQYKNELLILLNYDGTFSERIGYATGSSPVFVITEDLNSDIQIDIVCVNTGSDDISIYYGHGNGTFRNQIKYVVGSYPTSVAVGDFNNDNQLDLVVTNSGDSNVHILLNYRNESFGKAIIEKTISTPVFVAVGDFNSDALLDIAVVALHPYLFVHLRLENGSFARRIKIPIKYGGFSMIVRDLNNDGRLDLAVGNYATLAVGPLREIGCLGIILGYGNGSFANEVQYTAGSYVYSVVAGDFNNDTALDIITVNTKSMGISLFLGYGNGSFSDPIEYVTGMNPSSIVVDDFNNDHQLDIIVGNIGSRDMTILFGHTNRVFARKTILNAGNYTLPRSFVICDINNDLNMDIVAANSGSNSISVFLGYGNFSFMNALTESAGHMPISITAGDLNNDGQLDIIVANYGSRSVSILFGHGNGYFHEQTFYEVSTSFSPHSIAVADVDNNDLLDIIVANGDTNGFAIFLANNNGNFRAPIRFSTGYGSKPFFILADDFNNDRKADVLVVNRATDSLIVLLQTC